MIQNGACDLHARLIRQKMPTHTHS
jgi:hypothetical protein